MNTYNQPGLEAGIAAATVSLTHTDKYDSLRAIAETTVSAAYPDIAKAVRRGSRGEEQAVKMAWIKEARRGCLDAVLEQIAADERDGVDGFYDGELHRFRQYLIVRLGAKERASRDDS